MTKIDGFTLQQAIREAKAERDQAAKRFTPSLTAFPGDIVTSPRVHAEQFAQAEARLARLQAAQTQFNSTVRVQVEGKSISLLEAIKLVGGAGRLEAMWRSASAPQTDRYGMRDTVRTEGTVSAVLQVSYEDAADLRKRAGKRASALRAAIQKGNASEIDLDIEADLAGLLA